MSAFGFFYGTLSSHEESSPVLGLDYGFNFGLGYNIGYSFGIRVGFGVGIRLWNLSVRFVVVLIEIWVWTSV